MNDPYYQDDLVTLYHGDCLELTEWLAADVLVMDPPYGINDTGGYIPTWADGANWKIAGDKDTSARDAVLEAWGNKPAIAFGSPVIAAPVGVRQTLVWQKPPNTGLFGTVAGFRRDWEPIYLMGDLPKRDGAASAIIRTLSNDYKTGEHRHAKPIGLMERLVAVVPVGVVADPFAGSGSTLVAARNLGRRAIGVEIEERYCELIALRLAQGVLL